MEFIGLLKKKLPAQQGTSKAGKAWTKQEVIIEELGNKQYPSSIVATAFGDKIINALSFFNEGATVKAQVDFRVQEWQGRFFNSLNLWRIEPADQAQTPAPMQMPQQPNPAAAKQDDLPF
jgi:hypothetical protein